MFFYSTIVSLICKQSWNLHIDLYLYISGNTLIESVVKKHEEEIKSETLALEVKYNESRDTYTDTNINGEHINIDVEVIK